MENEKEGLSARERIVIMLVMFLVKMMKPWKYDHEYTEFWKELKENLK